MSRAELRRRQVIAAVKIEIRDAIGRIPPIPLEDLDEVLLHQLLLLLRDLRETCDRRVRSARISPWRPH